MQLEKTCSRVVENIEIQRKPCKETYVLMINPDNGMARFCPLTCGQTYGRCCYDQRYAKALKRLTSYPIKSKRLIHISIGFPKDIVPETKSSKKLMEWALTRFHRLVRKKYNWLALRVFDMEQNGAYIHFHYAMIPEVKSLDLRFLRRMIQKASKGLIKTINVHGFRSKRGLFKYFAKRVAGLYSHNEGKNKEVFFLEDIMSYAQYHELFFNVRSLVIIGSPKLLKKFGLTCNIAPVSFSDVVDLPHNWIYTGVFIKPDKAHPPPDHEITLDEALSYAKTQDFSRSTLNGLVYLGME